MAEVLFYKDQSYKTLRELDKDKTICLMALSPIEVHGDHLPVGTDVVIAEEVQKRLIEQVQRQQPQMNFMVLPPVYAGADPLPFPGSVSIPATTLESLLLSFGKALSEVGFKILIVTDNHGGPRHQMAIESAIRKAWKKYRFNIIAPFNSLYRKMVECDERLLESTGLEIGACGDDTDSHAGTNETSLMMVAAPDLIDRDSISGASTPPPVTGGAKLVSGFARMTSCLGGKRSGRDLEHLARTLAWVNAPNKKPFMGDPTKASRESGEAMLTAHVEEGLALLERAMRGEPVYNDPILWRFKFLRRLPG